MTVTSHSLDTITLPTDASTGIVDASQGIDTTRASETPRFSSADPVSQGSGPLAVEAGQEKQQPTQQVSTRPVGTATNTNAPGNSTSLNQYPRPQGPQLLRISSSLVQLEVTQPPLPQKRMLPTRIDGVSVLNDGFLRVPLHDLQGSHMPVRDYPMTPLYLNPQTTSGIHTPSLTQRPLIQNTTFPPLTSELSLVSVLDFSGPLTADRGYPMTPRLVNPVTPNLGKQTPTGTSSIPQGNGTNSALMDTRSHNNLGTALIQRGQPHP